MTYHENNPSENVIEKLLKEDTHSFLIKGYDSDSFFLELTNKLALSQPEIIQTPFTSLKKSLENIVDIEDKKHFKHVKERLEISKRQVDTAIQQFEVGNIKNQKVLEEEIDRDLIKRQIIDRILDEEFGENDIQSLEDNVNVMGDDEINKLLAGLINNFGVKIYHEAKLKNNEELYRKSIEKYEKATTINPNNDLPFNNWGSAICELAKLKNDKTLFEEVIEKSHKAYELSGKSYNLACGYALIQDKANALMFLENALKNKEETIDYIERDEDWDTYRDDPDFIALLDKYRE